MNQEREVIPLLGRAVILSHYVMDSVTERRVCRERRNTSATVGLSAD